MARISTYALDSNVTKNDKVIGTDSAGTHTRNYKISDITDFLNKSGSVETTGSRFKFIRPSNNTQTYGFIKLPVDQGATVAFSTISTIQLHKKSAAAVDINSFYETIEKSLVLLQKANDPTQFGVFEWNSSTQNTNNTDLYDIAVVFKGGNGSLQDEEDYLLSLLLFRFDDLDKHKAVEQATPSATWTMEHALNKKPSVTIVDDQGHKIMGKIEYDDANNVTIRFGKNVAGYAYFN
jgi:hypothetical protein|tara:strand:- start:3786 stop:4493 length:708 start_codon:yes stop_codon:yes gene_type:complete